MILSQAKATSFSLVSSTELIMEPSGWTICILSIEDLGLISFDGRFNIHARHLKIVQAPHPVKESPVPSVTVISRMMCPVMVEFSRYRNNYVNLGSGSVGIDVFRDISRHRSVDETYEGEGRRPGYLHWHCAKPVDYIATLCYWWLGLFYRHCFNEWWGDIVMLARRWIKLMILKVCISCAVSFPSNANLIELLLNTPYSLDT